MLSPTKRVALLDSFDEEKTNRAAKRDRETHVETRDGREFVVTVIPEAPPPKHRAADTRYHFHEVDKAGDYLRPAPARRKKRRST